jgi:hypothetical protein
MPAGFQPDAFQNTGFQTQSGFVAAAAMGAIADETATATRARNAAAALAELDAIAGTPLAQRYALAPGLAVADAITAPGRGTLRGAQSLASILGQIGASPQVGVVARTAFGQSASYAITPVRMARGAAALHSARTNLTSLGRQTLRSAMTLSGAVRWLSYGGLAFQTGAFQSNAFQVVVTERVNAKPTALLQALEGLVQTSLLGARQQVAFISQVNLVPTFGVHAFLSAVLGARAGHAGAARAGRLAETTFGITDEFFYHQILDAGGTLPVRVGITPFAIVPAAFQTNAFQTGAFQADPSAFYPRADDRAVRTIGESAGLAPSERSTRPATASALSTREGASGFGLRIVHASVDIGGTIHRFAYHSHTLIAAALGHIVASGAFSPTSASGNRTARAAALRGQVATAGSARSTRPAQGALAERAAAAGAGQRTTAATAAEITTQETFAATAGRATARPQAETGVVTQAAPGPPRVTARPVGTLSGQAGLTSAPSLVLRVARAVAVVMALSGRGIRATSDAAALGARHTASGEGLRTTRSSAILDGPLLGQEVGPVRVTAHPVGPIGLDAKIPATTTSLAAVAAQHLVARLAIPSAVRLGRFAVGSVIRAALAIAGLFNPQLIDHGRGVTLKNDHVRLRSLFRGTPRQRGLRNARPRDRSLP